MTLTCNAAVRRSHVLEIALPDNVLLACVDCALVRPPQLGRSYKVHAIAFESTAFHFPYHPLFQHSGLFCRPTFHLAQDLFDMVSPQMARPQISNCDT